MKLAPALTVATAAAALVLTPAAAHAESKVHLDRTGDVASISLNDMNVDPEDFVAEPGRTEGDVTSVRVTHLARTVRVSLAYKELNKSGMGRFIEMRVLSDKGVRDLELGATQGNWAGSQSFTDNDGDRVSCTGLSHKIDYVKNTVLVVIPRSCLRSPRWVRVAAVSGSIGDDATMFIDDARSSNYFGEQYVYGPKVRRG